MKMKSKNLQNQMNNSKQKISGHTNKINGLNGNIQRFQRNMTEAKSKKDKLEIMGTMIQAQISSSTGKITENEAKSNKLQR